MRKLYVFTFFLLSIFLIQNSNVAAQQYPKYVVIFKDKNNSPYRLDKPLRYLSQRAVDRRTKYNIAIDSSDLPVNPIYIKKVETKGPVTYLSQSKWLNQILILTTSDSAINLIKKLSFVKAVNPVGPASTTLQSAKNKFTEKIQPLNTQELKTTTTQTNKYDYGNSFGQVDIHKGEFLHNKGFTGKGIMITVIDAGFYHYKTTKAFDSARIHNQFLGERDFVDFDNSVNEDYDHGELCLSTIAANVPGVMVGTAPDASFWLLRSENVNSEFPVEEHNWAVAAEFADSVGTDLISSSLGYNQFDDAQFNHTYNDFYKNATMVSRAATFAAQKGILVTNSAGNEGSNSWKYLIFPADDDSVCAVAATDVNGNIASFSSYGYPGKIKPNIASVGSGTVLYSSFGVTSGSGTSFSNPNINGLIACLWQAFPEFNNMTILNAVYQSGRRYDNPNNRLGYGLPNMHKAYTLLAALRNKKLYGNEFMLTKTSIFTNSIAIKLIGQIDGDATIELVTGDKKVVSKINFATEAGEVYDKVLNNLDKLAIGEYTVVYKDANNTNTIPFKKVDVSNQSIVPVEDKAEY